MRRALILLIMSLRPSMDNRNHGNAWNSSAKPPRGKASHTIPNGTAFGMPPEYYPKLEDILSPDEVELIRNYRLMSDEKRIKLRGIAIGLKE